jgi:hypothetical protein
MSRSINPCKPTLVETHAMLSERNGTGVRHFYHCCGFGFDCVSCAYSDVFSAERVTKYEQIKAGGEDKTQALH